MGNIDYTKNPLVKKFIEVEASENKIKNIFLFAGGGYGKTTAMCCLFKYLLNKASNGEKFVPIYIDVKKLNFNETNPIISYIHSKYSGGDTHESDVKNLFSDQAPEFSKKYTYYILIDGLNETNDGNKSNLIDIISVMAEISNVRFVVSSRIKETFDKALFCVFELQKLNEEQIKDYLDKNFGKKYNEQTEVKRINKSLIEILQIPMFMKTFSKTYDKRSPYPDIYDEKTVRKADILDSYVQKILINLKERTNSYDNNILEFVINFYLPALAFQMVKLNGFFIPNENFENINIVLNKDYFSRFFDPDEIEIISDVFDSKSYKPLTIGIKQFAVLIKSNGYSFVHQIWRDFFAAKHIINCMNAEKLDELEISVDENIRQFVGELMRECDFEEKDNLETWSESPIEHFLQKHNMNSEKPISPMTTRNLIEIMKTCRNNNITANYSCLDLRLSSFIQCNIQQGLFSGASIIASNFMPYGHKNIVTTVALYSNGNKLASSSRDKSIRLWDANTGMELKKPLLGHTKWINQIAITNDEKYIISVSNDCSIRIWDLENGICDEIIYSAHKGLITCVCISDDDSRMATGSSDGLIKVWDLKNRTVLYRLKGHFRAITSLRFFKESNDILFSSSQDITIRQWDLSFTDFCNSVSHDELYIDKPLKATIPPIIHEINNSHFDQSSHTNYINQIDICSNNKYLVSVGNDGTISEWNLTVMDVYNKFHCELQKCTNNPDTFNYEYNNLLKKYNIYEIGKEKVSVENMPYYITSVCFVNEKMLINGNSNGHLSLRNTDDLSIIKDIVCHESSVTSISVLNNVVASGGTDKTIKIYDAKSLEKKHTISLMGINEVTCSVYYKKKNCLFCVSNNKLFIIDLNNGKIVKKTFLGQYLLKDLFLIEKRDLLVAISEENIILFIDIGNSICLNSKYSFSKKIVNIAYDFNYDRILVFFLNSVKIYNLYVDANEITMSFITKLDFKIRNGIFQNDSIIYFYKNKLYKYIFALNTSEKMHDFEKPINSIIPFYDGLLCVSWGQIFLIDKDKKKLIFYYSKFIDIICVSKKYIIVGCNYNIIVIDIYDNYAAYEFSIEGKVNHLYIIKENLVLISTNSGLIIWDCQNEKSLTKYDYFLPNNINKCDFSKVQFDSDNYIKGDFFCSIYQNGGIVPKEYEPKPIPVEWKNEELNDKELE